MKSIHKEPLFHFLVLAIGLFFLHSAVSHEEADSNDRQIVVDQDSLLRFIQFRTKSFEPAAARMQLESFSDEELQKVIDDYVREEALYREARSLELDRDDYVIKRRLVQKIDYVARGFAESIGTVSDEDVRRYFEENKADYYVEPRITFTHVFFGKGARGGAEATKLAEQALAQLKQQGAGFNDAPGYGERFLYGMNYVERSRLFVESHFGPDMTEALFALEPVRDTWYGPFASPHGAHLVMVTQKQAGYLPLLAEVRTRVAQEASRALAAERTKQATRQIVDSYDVEIVYARPDKKLARNDR